MDIGDLLKLQGAFGGDGKVNSSGYVVEIVLIFQLLAELDKLVFVPVQRLRYIAFKLVSLAAASSKELTMEKDNR